jgi:hypothetical protein
MAPSSVANILSAIVRLAREDPRYDTRREFLRIWLGALNRDFLSILYGRPLLIDRPCKLDVPLNPVNLSFFGFALGAIRCVDLGVTKPYRHLFERPTFAMCIHGDRDRRAGAKPPTVDYKEMAPCPCHQPP